MASTFPTANPANSTAAQTAMVNAGVAAGATQPTGGLAPQDYSYWMISELIKNAGAGTAASVTNGITAFATGGQTSATALTTPINRVSTCATIGDSVKLPTSTAGAVVTVINSGATGVDIFPVTGETIDTLAANTALRVATGTTVVFVCPVAGSWFASVTRLPYSKYTTDATGVQTVPVGLLTGASHVVAQNTANGAFAWTTRTATQMFADTPNARVADAYYLRITNTGNNTLTITAGSGVTLTGTATLATNTTRDFVVTFTSATALVMQQVGAATA